MFPVCILRKFCAKAKTQLRCPWLSHGVGNMVSQVQSKWKCWHSKFRSQQCSACISNKIHCLYLFWLFHILKTLIPWLKKTERERTFGRLTALDPPSVAANVFGVRSSIIFCLGIGSRPREQPRLPVGMHTLWGIQSSAKAAGAKCGS